MARKKLGLEDLAVVAEQELGIKAEAKDESQVAYNSDLSQDAVTKIEIEISYMENQIEGAKEASSYLLHRYVAAARAAEEIKKQHKRPEIARTEEEKELLEMKKALLQGAVVVDGIQIPQQKADSPIIEGIKLALKSIANGKARVAAIVANEYGFDSADEVFALVNSIKEKNDSK